jgi:hypothetical protein
LGYSHTQRGIIKPILLAAAGITLAVAFVVLEESPPARTAALAVACVLVGASFLFGSLTVRDEGDRLGVRFGPVPLFRRTIPYSEIARVERERSGLLAGWGIHYTRKGWLWNIGGFDCVRVTTPRGSTLIGTDDPEGLVAFLKSRIASGREATG